MKYAFRRKSNKAHDAENEICHKGNKSFDNEHELSQGYQAI